MGLKRNDRFEPKATAGTSCASPDRGLAIRPARCRALCLPSHRFRQAAHQAPPNRQTAGRSGDTRRPSALFPRQASKDWQQSPAQPTFIESNSRRNLRTLDLCHRVAQNGSQLRAASFIAKGWAGGRIVFLGEMPLGRAVYQARPNPWFTPVQQPLCRWGRRQGDP